MSSEKVHVKLGLSGTYWDRKPQYRVELNGVVLHEATIQADSNTVEYLEFDVEYLTSTASLSIVLLNKLPTDTVENADKTAIVKDMLLNIISVEVDEIDLGMIPFEQGVYTPNAPVVFNGETTNSLKNCLNLGWNGTWTLTWNNPFYIWLLENI